MGCPFIGHFGEQPAQTVQGAQDTSATPVQNMGINHGRGHVGMPQQLLNGPNILTLLEWSYPASVDGSTFGV